MRSPSWRTAPGPTLRRSRALRNRSCPGSTRQAPAPMPPALPGPSPRRRVPPSARRSARRCSPAAPGRPPRASLCLVLAPTPGACGSAARRSTRPGRPGRRSWGRARAAAPALVVRQVVRLVARKAPRSTAVLAFFLASAPRAALLRHAVLACVRGRPRPPHGLPAARRLARPGGRPAPRHRRPGTPDIRRRTPAAAESSPAQARCPA